MENGLDRFFYSLARHKGRIIFRAGRDNWEIKSTMQLVGMNQLSLFFLLYIVQITIAIVIFIIELIITHRMETTENAEDGDAFV